MLPGMATTRPGWVLHDGTATPRPVDDVAAALAACRTLVPAARCTEVPHPPEGIYPLPSDMETRATRYGVRIGLTPAAAATVIGQLTTGRHAAPTWPEIRDALDTARESNPA